MLKAKALGSLRPEFKPTPLLLGIQRMIGQVIPFLHVCIRKNRHDDRKSLSALGQESSKVQLVSVLAPHTAHNKVSIQDGCFHHSSWCCPDPALVPPNTKCTGLLEVWNFGFHHDLAQPCTWTLSPLG